jgi:hypothetical protein
LRPPSDEKLLSALQNNLQLADDATIELRSIVQREGLSWFELKATGKSVRLAGDIFAASYLRLEPGKRIIRVDGICALSQRADCEPRFKTLVDGVGLR